MAKVIHVMPNPYSALDAKGLLAGVCQMAEERRPGSAEPANMKVGARVVMVDGTFNNNADEGRGEFNGFQMGPLGTKAEYVCEFDSAPVAIQISPTLEGFYLSRAKSKNGTPPDIFIVTGPDALPLEGLAEQRLDCIARFKAAYGAEPPVEKWVAQFELDSTVADLMSLAAAKRDAEAKVAADVAKKAKDAAETDAKKAKADRDAARAKALDAAKKAYAIPPLDVPAKPQKPATSSEK